MAKPSFFSTLFTLFLIMSQGIVNLLIHLTILIILWNCMFPLYIYIYIRTIILKETLIHKVFFQEFLFIKCTILLMFKMNKSFIRATNFETEQPWALS